MGFVSLSLLCFRSYLGDRGYYTFFEKKYQKTGVLVVVFGNCLAGKIIIFSLKNKISAVNRSVVSSSLSGAAKKKASIKMGAFLFIYIPR